MTEVRKCYTLNQPVKVTVLVGKLKGKSYLLKTPKDVTRCGFSQNRVNGVIMGAHNTHRKCVFAVATPEEIKTLSSDVSKGTFEETLNIHGNTKYEVTATCCSTGKSITHIGFHKFELLGFNRDCIKNVLGGRAKTHAGHLWSAVPLATKLPDIKFGIVGTCLLTGKQVKALTSLELAKMGFNSSGVRNVLAGINKTHGRHTWVRTPL